MKLQWLPLFFLLASSAIVVAASDSPLADRPIGPSPDVTIYDEYLGKINSSHPMYWGNHTYYMDSPWFYVQSGGVHNHARWHTVWNTLPCIVNVTNTVFIEEESRVLVYQNMSLVGFSNGSRIWVPAPMCPLGNRSMHALEFSERSRAVYWFCHQYDHRLILGQILG